MSTPSDQYDEAEAAREAEIGEANRVSASAVRHNNEEARYTWNEWYDAQQAQEFLPAMEIGFLKPDLFLFADYQAMGDSEEPDAIYLNLNQVTRVDTFGSFKITLTDGSSVQTNDATTIERFWEQWEIR